MPHVVRGDVSSVAMDDATEFTQPPFPDAARVREQFARLVARVVELDGPDVDGWTAFVEELHDVTAALETVGRHAELAVRRDTTDEVALDRRRRYQREIAPALDDGRADVAAVVFDEARPERAAALASVTSRCYVERLRTARRLAGADPDARAERDEVVNEYTKLLGAIRVDLDGRDVPLTQVRSVLNRGDRAARRAAFTACEQAIATVAPSCNELLARSIDARTRMARSAGFESFVEYRYAELGRTDFRPEDVARFRSAMLEHVGPLARELRARQATAIDGATTGSGLVHPADASFHPVHQVGALPAPDELVARVEQVLAGVAPELGAVVASARRDGRIDLEARAGKAPGAYCATFPDTGEPFVLTNLVGVGRDVKVLVHEFGHASQSVLASPIVPWDARKPSLETCEVHSMALELLALPHMHHVFDEPTDAAAYRSLLLEGGVTHALFCCAIDEFQHDLYSAGAPNPAEAASVAWERVHRAYAPGLDHDATPAWTSTCWTTYRHVLLFPFYFIDYAIAQVVAWRIWLDSLRDPTGAVDRYLRLCRLGGTMSMHDLLEAVGIGNPFDPAFFDALMPDLRAAIGMSP